MSARDSTRGRRDVRDEEDNKQAGSRYGNSAVAPLPQSKDPYREASDAILTCLDEVRKKAAATGQYLAAVRALELLGREAGLFRQQVAIVGLEKLTGGRTK